MLSFLAAACDQFDQNAQTSEYVLESQMLLASSVSYLPYTIPRQQQQHEQDNGHLHCEWHALPNRVGVDQRR